MSALMQDPMFFYTVAFVIFLALAYRYARKPMLAWLDEGILQIRSEVEEAQKLRNEAEAMLVEYKAKQKAALEEAESIVQYARSEAESLRREAEADLKDMIARQEQQAAERIAIAEAEAIAEVRAATVDLAMKIARETLAAQLDDATAAKLADQVIADLKKPSPSKAEAA